MKFTKKTILAIFSLILISGFIGCKKKPVAGDQGPKTEFFVKTLTYLDWNQKIAQDLSNPDSAQVLKENKDIFQPPIVKILELIKKGELKLYDKEMVYSQYENPKESKLILTWGELFGEKNGDERLLPDSIFCKAFETILSVTNRNNNTEIKPVYLQLNVLLENQSMPMYNVGFVKFSDISDKSIFTKMHGVEMPFSDLIATFDFATCPSAFIFNDSTGKYMQTIEEGNIWEKDLLSGKIDSVKAFLKTAKQPA